jgi:hypothetical protein
MQRNKRFLTSAAITVLIALTGSGASFAGDASAGEATTGTWEHHQTEFNYFGITALYSCDGLESNVHSLLLHLGARKDAKVRARGCPHGSSVPGRYAIVALDFYTLAPGDANSADAIQAQWIPVMVSPNHPYFMGHGDCELIDEIKDIISKNFSLRDLKYRTDCVPHQINIDDFSIKAQVLKALPAVAKASGS